MDRHENPVDFGHEADLLIDTEIDRQDCQWGKTQDRADVGNGQLLEAAEAHVMGVNAKRANLPHAIGEAFYPDGWTGYRDYGSDVANLVVAAAFIRQEIKRLIANGADTTRLPRQEQTSP